MEKRQKEFQKNLELEKYLEEINGDLLIAEQRLLKSTFPKYPVILVMGALRSGTTLATQWLANTGEFVCPSNLVPAVRRDADSRRKPAAPRVSPGAV